MVSTAADEFQLLAFKLRSWAVQRNAKIFVIASAVGGEGKSFVALNLAAALAVSGSGTLLIDADIRAPFQHYSFPVPKNEGLLAYLQGSTELAATIIPTPIPGLSLMPSGGTSNRAPEYLASVKMDQLIQTVKGSEGYQYIIIDTPPSLLVPDAQILSRASDGTIIVTGCRQHRTRCHHEDVPDVRSAEPFRGGVEPVQALFFHSAKRTLWPLRPLWPIRALWKYSKYSKYADRDLRE